MWRALWFEYGKRKRKECCIEKTLYNEIMRKRILLVISFLLLGVTTLVGCGSKTKQANEFSVSWVDGTTELRKDTVKDGDKLTAWEPGKTGYYFSNWYSDKAFNTVFDFTQEIKEDKTIYARFSVNQLTVSYYDDDKILDAKFVDYGGVATSYTPTKEGFDFMGWYTDKNLNSKYNFSSKVESNLKLYAGFKESAEVIMQYPITLATDGKTFTYGNPGETQTIEINEHNIYLDGKLTDEDASKFDNVYNSFNEAIEHAVDGTESAPMTIYIAPYVYWIHDPKSENTTEAFGITKTTANLHMIGLTEDARNVVIAANYGHNEGYDGGNWTMFNLGGDGLTLKNMTFGDYCNVDLEYPLDPTLNYPKRTDNVTQGQIASYSGDKLFASNVRFVSRLNMMPFNNSKRAVYYKCHMESTDDALNGAAQSVYIDCDFEFYSSKPWYSTSNSTLLNCTMKIVHINTEDTIYQYLCKAASRYTVVDCNFVADTTNEVVIGWCDVMPDNFQNYYSNVTYNGNPIKFDLNGARPNTSVDISGTDFLKTYKLIDFDGSVIYNVYNLVRGNDEWDPLGQKEKVLALNASDLPTTMTASSSLSTIETGNATSIATITYNITGPQATDYNANSYVEYQLSDEDKAFVELIISEDHKSCTVIGKNEEELPRLVLINVVDKSGIQACVAITVRPSILAAPTFTSNPVITQNTDGTASVDYTLDLGQRDDMSRITWSVCDDATGTNPIEIFVGRSNIPLKTIKMKKAYVGKYLMVSIERKHIRSDYALPDTFISTTAIGDTGITTPTRLTTDFSDISVKAQPTPMKGFFAFDAIVPADCIDGYIPLDATEVSTKYSAKVSSPWSTKPQSWAYGTGAKNGFLNKSGITQTGRGARITYLPEGTSFNDMDFTVVLAPGKTASQGFGSDYQYMDLMIKYDAETGIGYGLRIYRKSGDSCEFVLMEHKGGKSKEISTPIESSAYVSDCTVHIWTEGTTLNATVNSTKAQSESQAAKGYKENVTVSATITSNTNGGFVILHTGTVGDNSTYITSLDVEWK